MTATSRLARHGHRILRWMRARAQARARVRLAVGALLGLVTAGVALAVGQVAAIFTGQSSAPVYAVGSAAVNLTPAPVKEYAIAHFGENDKQMLILGILAILGVIAMLAGIMALRWFAAGAVLVALFGVTGIVAALQQADSTVTSVLPSALGAVVAIAALRLLVRLYQRTAETKTPRTPRDPELQAQAQVQPKPPPAGDDAMPSGGTDRRRFIATTAALAVGSAASAYGANLIITRRYSVQAARAAVRIPKPAYPAPPIPAGVHPNVAGLSSFMTSNDDFYRVDTDLVLPQVRPDGWTLRIHGMVDHPLELSFADLLNRPLREHDMTVSCVSDPVGGPYVGTARWIGADVPALLRAAGVQRGADQLLAGSVDGMTIGTPLESVLDGRRAMLAVAMNGEPLPVAHGFPARMLIPGFYGYSSACKWVTDLYVTTFAQQTAYWVKRGYARIGTMKTQSRIDVPKPLARLSTGQVTVAGVAWATDRGIADVQVQVDQGPWQQARLAATDNPDTWRQWTYSWQATAGTHSIQVRAADDTGQYQTSVRADPIPSGASGWDSVVVTVA